MDNRNYLFCQSPFSEVCRGLEDQISNEVNNLQANYLLNVSIDDVIKYLIDKYTMECPTLDKDKIMLCDHGEKIAQFEGHRGLTERKVNFYEFAIPYSGDKGLFFFQPSTFTYNPPSAVVLEHELRVNLTSLAGNAQEIKSELEKTLSDIERFLGWLSDDTKVWNNRVKEITLQRVNSRKEKLLKDQGIVASLGFPIRKRGDAPLTYSVPVKKKKIMISRPSASNESFKPEPVLEINEYNNILQILSNMVYVMERSPRAFSGMREEDLRTHFLVQLNGHYEGQATGETFNYEGRTDILIRVNGKNIFIAECKFWTGPEGFKETIDQILGYLSWRDTKVAILLFNRNKDFSKTLSQIPEVMNEHPNFKRNLNYNHESEFRVVLHSNGDKNRELTVTISAFDVPK